MTKKDSNPIGPQRDDNPLKGKKVKHTHREPSKKTAPTKKED